MADGSSSSPAFATPWYKRAINGLLHDAPDIDPANPADKPPAWKVFAVNAVARAVVYGPFLALAAVFCPMGIPALLLSAGQPWVGNAASWAASKVQKLIPQTKPLFDKLSQFSNNKWWPAIGAIAVATIPAPALLGSLAHHLPGFIAGAIGSVDSVWAQALPFALVSALPTATAFTEKVLDRLPILRDAAAFRRFEKTLRDAADDVGHDLDHLPTPEAGGAAEPGVSHPAAPSPAAPSAPPATPGSPTMQALPGRAGAGELRGMTLAPASVRPGLMEPGITLTGTQQLNLGPSAARRPLSARPTWSVEL